MVAITHRRAFSLSGDSNLALLPYMEKKQNVMKKKTSIITVVIATYNSEKKLSEVLTAIRSQSISAEEVEILLIDGGSKDKTEQIAKEFNCRIISNPRTEPVYAKFLGFIQALGQYIIYIDHDEVIQNKHSFANKIASIEAYPNVCAAISSGYQNPAGYAFINEYINEFGDPFSFFIYRLSKSAKFFLPTMKSRYKIIHDTALATYFQFSPGESLPIIELCAAASMINKAYIREHAPLTLKQPDLIPHFFYLVLPFHPLIALVKNDVLLHYSSDTFTKYLKKIQWRIKNNIFNTARLGSSGFSGRSEFHSHYEQMKKYLFLPYGLFLFPVLIDSLWLCLSRKNFRYLIHIPLCLFTIVQILYYYLMKLGGNIPQLKSYDESTVIANVRKR
jgi:glycosyltransferase involved in cell wall biosynthesis